MNARTLALLIVLTLIAGYVDAVAFFGLGVFTANMTGNTVLLGGAIAARLFPQLPGSIGVLLPLLSIVCFVAGAAFAAIVLRGAERDRGRRIAIVALVLIFLVATALLQRVAGTERIAVALLSAVMGLQSAVAVRAGVPGISTTYVTGTLVTAVGELAGESSAVRRQGAANAAVWACYLAGAVCGAAGLHLLAAGALWVPAIAVALLIPMLL